jgi:hypothetical protein
MKISLYLSVLFIFLGIHFSAQANNDTLRLKSSKKHSVEAAAATPESEKGLEELELSNQRFLEDLKQRQLTEDESMSVRSDDSEKGNSNKKSKSLKKKSKKKAAVKLKKSKTSKNKKARISQEKRGWSWGNWALSFKWLELDWWLVGFAIALFLGLIVLLFILLTGNVLTLFEMILFALGFGFAIFSYIFLGSESDGGRGAYEFFVKYGLFSWVGIMAIIAGFAGLFGATGVFSTYLLVGLIIGGISFIISLILGDSIFTGYEFRKF